MGVYNLLATRESKHYWIRIQVSISFSTTTSASPFNFPNANFSSLSILPTLALSNQSFSERSRISIEFDWNSMKKEKSIKLYINVVHDFIGRFSIIQTSRLNFSRMKLKIERKKIPPGVL